MYPARSPRAVGRVPATLLALITLLAFATATAVSTAVPASAHATLVSITPTAGQVLSAPPTTVRLVFDDPISTSFAGLAVTDPAGRVVSAPRPTVLGSTLEAAVTARALISGTYRVVWRVVSDDGHPVSGQSTFVLAMGRLPGAGGSSPGPGSATPLVGTPTSGPVTSAAASPTSTAASSGHAGLLVSGLIALVVVLAGLVTWRRRRG